MSFHGKRERVEDGNGYGPPQKRPGAGFSGGSQPTHGSYSGHGRPPYEGFSSQYNQPPASQPRSGPYPPFAEDKSGCVLLVTVINPKYPITVDVINTICTNSNVVVNRIVIMKKNGVQAMIEFDSPQGAETVKETLNGADIYSGCCTLKIEYAKVSRLNVTKNDQDSWDYTVSKQGQDAKVLPLLPDPKFNAERGGGGPGFADYLEEGKRGAPQGPPPSGFDGGYQDRYRGPGGPGGPDDFNFHRNAPGDRFNSGGGPMPPSRGPPGPRQEFHPPAYEPHGSRYPHEGYGSSRGRGSPYPGGPGRGGPRPMYPPMGGGHPRMDEYQDYDEAMGSGPMLQQGSVMMVYGLEAEKMNCMRLFNLFCLYGNVVRIKFLKSKDGVAMVQMGDCHSCERAANGLNGTFLFGKKILIGNSKQAFIQDVPNPSELPDGSPSFKDFMGNRNNRFTTPEAAAKNRIHSSSKILYFFNAPPGLKEEDLVKVFRDGHVKEPKKIKVFPTKSEKSSTGLIEWDSKSDSVEALVVCNHTPLQNPTGKNPYILKFCFSDVTIKSTPSSNTA